MARQVARRGAASALIAALFFALLALPFLAIIGRALLLGVEGKVVTAVVLEAPYNRFTAHSYDTVNSPYSVQYEFHLPGSKHLYRYWEPMLSGEPAAGLAYQPWRAAKKAGTIRVVYWPGDPWINLPEEASPLDGIICPGLAATTTAMISLLYCLSYRRKMRAAKSAAAQTGAG